MTGVYSYSPFCKHCIGIKTNEIGETIVYCECSDLWKNVTLGECFDNCEAQETTDGRKPWKWGGARMDGEEGNE